MYVAVRITNFAGGCWPTPHQELLLKATLLPTEDAVTAWRGWCANDALERLDAGSYRLLPLTYRNLQRLGCDDPAMMRLKGVSRRTWCENHVLFQRMAPLLARFHDAGIPTLLLKGAALTLLHYRDFALRPMDDLDILVPEDCALDAVSLLEADGWSRTTLQAVKLEEFFLRYRQSAEFTRPPKDRFDLHWHVLLQACHRNADQPFWDASIPVEFEGHHTRCLCATDQLLHCCVHGVAWNAIPPLRWVADAFWVLESSPVDWQRLVEIAAACHVVLPLRDGLRYLGNSMQAPVPEAVVKKLESMPVSPAEVLEYKYYLKQLESPGVSETARVVYAQFRRTVQEKSFFEQAAAIPVFLQHYWNLGRRRQTISRTFNYGMRRLRFVWPARTS